MSDPSIRELKAIVESYNQEVEEASRMPDGSPVPDSLMVDIEDTEVWKNRNKPRGFSEPKTNMCPSCEGAGCDECAGVGEIFESYTRKDFRMVADLISQIEDDEGRQAAVELYGDVFAESNPLFNREKFAAACVPAAVEEDVVDINKYSDYMNQHPKGEAECPECGGPNGEHTDTCMKGTHDAMQEDEKPYATMKDGPDKYLFRKDQKQKLVGSADNEPQDGEEELEETDMDKFIREMQIAAGIVVEDEAIEEETVEEETVDEEVIEETEEVDEEVVDEEEAVEEGKLPDALKKHQFGAKDDDSDDSDDSDDDDDSGDDKDDDKEEVDEDVANWMKRFDRLSGPVNEEVIDEEEVDEEEAVDEEVIEEAEEVDEEIVDEEEAVDEEVIEEAEEVDEEVVDEEEAVDEEVIEEDCDDPAIEPDGGCSPFTHADDNVDMVREEGDENPLGVDHACPECSGTGMGYGIEAGDCAACSGSGVNEDSFGEDLLLAPPGDVGPSLDDDREPSLDRQTDFNAPDRYDGDDSFDMREEPNDDERIIDVGDDEDYETYDFDNEFEQMLGGSSDPIEGGRAGGMYEMNDLRRLAGLEQIAEEIVDEEQLDEIGPVVAAVARGAGAALADAGVDALTGGVEEDSAASDVVAYDISDEKVYYVMADILGNELDFGPEDEVLVPAARNDQVLVALDQQGFEKNVDFCVAGEQYEADLQNGYDDRAFTDGQDYFPKGAQSQPATDLGPTAGGLRDNPMANKMRSVEKDDVYEGMKLAYRRHRKA